MDDTKYDVYYKSRKTGRTYESLGQLKTDEAKWDADHKAEVEKLNARKADAAKVEEARKEYEKVCADVEELVLNHQQQVVDVGVRFFTTNGKHCNLRVEFVDGAISFDAWVAFAHACATNQRSAAVVTGHCVQRAFHNSLDIKLLSFSIRLSVSLAMMEQSMFLPRANGEWAHSRN